MINSNLKVIRLVGKDIFSYLHELALLRIKIFYEYPYLYDGNLDYEYSYLKTYTKSDLSLFLIAFDHNKVIGMSTAIPLNSSESEMAETHKPFLEQNLCLDDFFYLGESVLLPEYRGCGLYKEFFRHREYEAQKLQCKKTVFFAVDRKDCDPRRPIRYRSLDEVWQYFGYIKQPSLITHFAWQEIGETSISTKPMVGWVKDLTSF